MLLKWLYDFSLLLFPNRCVVCTNHLVPGEKFLCLHCIFDLPHTGYLGMNDNPVTRTFTGRMNVEHAAAWLHFEKGGKVQSIMHAIKYKQRPELAEFMGSLLGKELVAHKQWSDCDVVIPVPIHPSKKRIRGYNQSEHLARGLAEQLGIPVDVQTLSRKLAAPSQTKKKRFERWENVQEVFEFRHRGTFPYRHVLLVDDVVTTGATLEACGRKIIEGCGAGISLLTLARSD